jgi:hypothetical protein
VLGPLSGVPPPDPLDLGGVGSLWDPTQRNKAFRPYFSSMDPPFWRTRTPFGVLRSSNGGSMEVDQNRHLRSPSEI